ncbi:MAG: DUF4132 domain-containing protein [Planctomycetes bacterium]|nr:DUF4132 domain-containing protein [Planctomycetota bacterium]
MFYRQLKHPKTKSVCFVGALDCNFVVMGPKSGHSSGYQSAGQALETAVEELKKLLKAGYIETELSLSFRFLLHTVGAKQKFFWIELIDNGYRTGWGKGAGQLGFSGHDCSHGQEKFFESAAEARNAYDKQIAKKLAEGYVEQHPRSTSYSTPVVVTKADPAPKKAAKSPAAKKSKSTATASHATPATSPQTPRRFVFTDSSSHKFWTIARDGATHTVTFGKVGTNGQTQTRDFDTPEAALKACDKLIAEKVGKGYVEETAAPGITVPSPSKGATKNEAAKKKVPLAPASPSAAAAQPSVPQPVPLQVSTEVTHRIDLAPVDWFFALWRDPDPLPQPVPRPFDLAARLEELRRVKGSIRTWAAKSVPKVLSREEAHFWIEVLHLHDKIPNPFQLAQRLQSGRFDGSVSIKKLEKIGVPYLQMAVLPVDEYLELMIRQNDSNVAPFICMILPYLSRSKRKELAKEIGPRALSHKKTSYHLPALYALAGALGCHDVVEQLLPQPKEGSHLLPMIYGLGSAARVEQEVDRHQQSKLWRWSEEDYRGWLAHTEDRRLDLLLDRSTRCHRDELETAIGSLTLVKSPAVAVPLLRCRQAGRGGPLATAWLDEQVGNAVAGLIAIPAADPLSSSALDYLRLKQRQGFAGVIEKALAGQPANVVELIRAEVLNVEPAKPEFNDRSLPPWLRDAIAAATALKPLKGSDFVQPDELPSLVVGDRQLSIAQTGAVLLALQHSEFGKLHPLVQELRTRATGASRHAFAWKLFETWIANTAPPAHKWAMRGLGYFGTDTTVNRLTPLVRNWPGESQHPRAVIGLDCLRAIGSSAALMQLSSIGQKLKFKALQQKAIEYVEAVAADMGLTKDELEDRVVPDAGLDEQGGCEFDFGPRRFTFAFDSDLKPAIRDETGAVRKDLPKPGAKDDPEKAREAAAAFTDLKKRLRDILKVQTLRLEQALVTGRRWPVEDFRTLLVNHPLMRHLTRWLLWSGWTQQGKPAGTFRITEERDAADVDDRPVDLTRFHSIGLVHPLHLTEQEKSRWGEVFADYEIFPPFAQLGRPVYRLEPKDAKERDLAGRFSGSRFPAIGLVGTLERLGWTRGPAQDNGVFREHYKHFRTFDLTACVTYDDGIAYGMMTDERDQEITGCLFVRGLHKPRGWPRYKPDDKLPLGKVDPVVVSETLADIKQIRPTEK